MLINVPSSVSSTKSVTQQHFNSSTVKLLETKGSEMRSDSVGLLSNASITNVPSIPVGGLSNIFLVDNDDVSNGSCVYQSAMSINNLWSSWTTTFEYTDETRRGRRRRRHLSSNGIKLLWRVCSSPLHYSTHLERDERVTTILDSINWLT